MASHYFDYHDPPVTGGRCVHPIKPVHYDSDSRIESERCRSGLEIVVDCLWDADAINTRFLQLLRRDHRAIAPDNDQRLYLKLVQDLFGAFNDIRRHNGSIASANLGNKMTAIRRAIASRVAKGRPLHRIDSCFPGALPLNDADTQFPSGPGEQLLPGDWHTGSNNHRTARCDLS